ncbi:MAG: DUF4442 domain-containing protein [Bdellovibrionales bacterium]|nr:DUF4442 domain-containing protein [Bdellovibrionales bacterium]
MIPRHVYSRWLFNLWPCIWFTGARVLSVSPDFKELRVKLPLNLHTYNWVGTIFGGSIYAAADPFFMVMLIEILGKSYVVWDKGASVRFRRPGKTTLYYDFKLTDEVIATARSKADAEGEYTFDLYVNAIDEAGVVHAEITKTMYVATKEFYKKKIAARALESGKN